MALTPKVIRPESGVVGLLDGQKEAGQRVDFKPDKFVLAIESKGYRLAWSRAARCPCESINDQTDQADPNCDLCDGSGWFYFAPTNPVGAAAGELDATQAKVVETFNAGVIRGIMTGGSTTADPYTKQINWVEGQMQLTVRPENKIAHYDRLINLDSELTFRELRKAGPTSTPYFKPRSHATTVHLIRSLTTDYAPTTDYTLEEGKIVWQAGSQPAEDTLLVLHYQTYPVWLVVTHPHVIRGTPIKYKTASPATPQGDYYALPIQALVQYEFLVGSAGKTGTAIED